MKRRRMMMPNDKDDGNDDADIGSSSVNEKRWNVTMSSSSSLSSFIDEVLRSRVVWLNALTPHEYLILLGN
jgi:hypothetical protein